MTRNTNTYRINSMLLDNPCMTEKIRGNQKYLKTMKMGNHHKKSVVYSQSSSKRAVYSDTSLRQETRKTSDKQPKLSPKRTGKKNKQTQR